MKNYIKEFMNDNRLQINEKFNIKECIGTFRFDSDYKFCNKFNEDRYDSLLTMLLSGALKIDKSILNVKEREYLEYVLKPFIKEIEHIKKLENWYRKEFILISFKGGELMQFPSFEKSSMYKNMELNKYYTLQELGLE